MTKEKEKQTARQQKCFVLSFLFGVLLDVIEEIGRIACVDDILKQHVVIIILLIIYSCFLFFSLCRSNQDETTTQYLAFAGRHFDSGKKGGREPQEIYKNTFLSLCASACVCV